VQKLRRSKNVNINLRVKKKDINPIDTRQKPKQITDRYQAKPIQKPSRTIGTLAQNPTLKGQK
jgi:hypothetical protein